MTDQHQDGPDDESVTSYVIAYARTLEPAARYYFARQLGGALREILLKVDDPVLIEAARGAIAGRTGQVATDEQAAFAASIILAGGGEQIRRPAEYVIAAIKRDKNPHRFLPAHGGGESDTRAWLLGA